MLRLTKSLLYRVKAIRLCNLHKDNQFMRDLVKMCCTWNVEGEVICNLLNLHYEHNGEIDRLLYRLLSDSDKYEFLRFFIKRFSGHNTYNESEKKLIDEAFDKAKQICLNSNGDAKCSFIFEGKQISFVYPLSHSEGNDAERRLMSYYPVAHCFFLREYEKEGFNPKDGGVIFDCGAAYGDTALFFSTLYPNSEIISFEYGDEAIDYAYRNIQDNKVSNVKLEKAYLYSETGVQSINDNGKISTADDLHANTIEVNTVSLDYYVENNKLNDIRLIKFDIEGGEQSALQGAVNTILKYHPILYIPIYHLDDDVYKIPAFIKELGIPYQLSIKWTEKLVWGVDCVLYVKFL